MKKEYKLVLIEWLDSKGVTEKWEFLNDIEPLKPSRCTSIGFLLDDAREYKTIVQSISNNQVLGRMTIPSCSIKKTRAIK